MTHSDELVDRVARAIYEAAPIIRSTYSRNTTGTVASTEYRFDTWDEVSAEPPCDSMCAEVARETRDRARAALSALPSHELLRDALEWIEKHYANQDISHEDFRVEAYARALEALTQDQP